MYDAQTESGHMIGELVCVLLCYKDCMQTKYQQSNATNTMLDCLLAGGHNCTPTGALVCFMPDAARKGYLFASFLCCATCRRCSIICITASFLCLLSGFLLGFFLFCSCHLLQQIQHGGVLKHVAAQVMMIAAVCSAFTGKVACQTGRR